jgi:hypothetical protein
MPSFRLGDALGEFADVASADQLALEGVTPWRHGPVISGGVTAPDPPLRVPAPEPLELGILVTAAGAGGHGGHPLLDGVTGATARRSLAAAARAAPASPGMTMARMAPGGGGWQPVMAQAAGGWGVQMAAGLDCLHRLGIWGAGASWSGGAELTPARCRR